MMLQRACEDLRLSRNLPSSTGLLTPLTVSSSVAERTEQAGIPAQVKKAADAALYNTTESGLNRSEVSGGPTSFESA